MVGLYVVPGIDDAFPFMAKSQDEISEHRWFRFEDLPADRFDDTKPYRGKHFSCIYPFIEQIKSYIENRNNV